MSIIGDITKIFTGPVEDVVSLANKTWEAIKGIWYAITHPSEMLDAAWNWMVNGTDWIVYQVAVFASHAETAVLHVLLTTIPKAIGWAISETWKLAKWEIERAYNELRYVVRIGTNFLLSLIYKVAKDAEGVVRDVVRWVTHAVEWVDKFGAQVWNLLSHPERLVKWIMGSLVGPFVIELARLSVPVLAFLFKSWTRNSSELAHVAEDLITKIT